MWWRSAALPEYAATSSTLRLIQQVQGLHLCARNCPVNAISGAVKGPHTIDQDKCIHCGLCMSNCRFDAISKH